MIEIKAPNKYDKNKKIIFLAGSIEEGKAEKWQDIVISKIKKDVQILNPRREHWNDLNKESFKEQVEWELIALEEADRIIMYYDPNTKSPISLLEFGLYARSGKLLVCCPDGFWKKGNIEIVCDRYEIPLFNTLNNLIEAIL